MIAETILNYAKEAGLEEAEIYQSQTQTLRFDILDGQPRQFVVSDKSGLSLRGTRQGRCASAYTEKTDEASLRALAIQCRQLADALETEDTVLLTPGQTPMNDDRSDDTLARRAVSDKIEFMKKVETAALKQDSRILRVSACGYQETASVTTLANTQGLEATRRSTLGLITLSVIASNGKEQTNGFSWRAIKDLDEDQAAEFVEEAVREAVNKLDAVSIPSGNYRTILRYDVATDLLASLWAMFSAEQIQKDLSILKDRQGESIMSPLITIVDEPQLPDGFSSCDFDDEGVPTQRTVIVENGVFKEALFDRKSALKGGRASTGNGFKNGCSAPVQVSPTNLLVKPGDLSLDEMIAQTEDGVLITDLQGLHAGLNPLTSDFSLQASGFKIEQGKLAYPIHLITIAGNYLEMMNSILALGCDGRQDLNSVSCGSLLVDQLAISGE